MWVDSEIVPSKPGQLAALSGLKVSWDQTKLWPQHYFIHTVSDVLLKAGASI